MDLYRFMAISGSHGLRFIGAIGWCRMVLLLSMGVCSSELDTFLGLEIELRGHKDTRRKLRRRRIDWCEVDILSGFHRNSDDH